MNLDTIITENTGEFQYKHPRTGEPLGLFVTLCGPEHEKRRNFKFRNARDQRVKVKKAGGNVGAMFDGDPQEEEQEVLAHVADCTVSWRREEKVEGSDELLKADHWEVGQEKQLACSPANMLKLLKTKKLRWFRQQTLDFFNDDMGFTTG